MTTNKKFSVIEELDKLNKLFAKRYTDEDKEYIQMANAGSTSPPIVDDWGQQNQRRHYANDRYRNHYHQDRSRSPPYYYNKRR